MKYAMLLSGLMIFGFQAHAADKCADKATFKEVSLAELQKTVETKGAYVIDVNGTKSFTKTHIPTAVNYETIKTSLASNLPADKNAPIVAYCGGPSCVAWLKAATEACKLGYTNVAHFKGGITGWNDSAKTVKPN